MSNNWTPAQKNAIDARGMRVLVSAAAGSGKTSVLTERVKNILVDYDNPCSVSEILVVTFTRAAAGEMRDRIYKALREEAVKAPNSDYINEQMILLPTADICTIDSFCSKIVRENFSRADISLDFTLLDNKEIDEITNEAVQIVLDRLYEENDSAFIELTSMFLNERDDGKLSEIICELYKFSRSYPFPDFYLNKIVEAFDEEKEPNDTRWADSIYKFVGLFADFHYKRLMRCVSLLEESGGFSPDYFIRFTETANNLLNLKRTVDDRNWDGMVSLINSDIIVAPRATNRNVDAYIKELTTKAFDECKKNIGKLNELTLPTIEEHKEDSKKLKPIVSVLCRAVTMLSETLSEMKKERNGYAFDDILHKCIDLLVEVKDDGECIRTPVAEALRAKYKEILIDEYQDTNDAQNMIFEAISKDTSNLYCVGDVKQSIYKFRLASPELFMALKKRLADYDGENHPSQINLDSNFRSRKGVTDVTNHIFKTLMSETVGEIDYNDREALVCGADYYPEKNTPDVELLCLDYKDYYPVEALKKEADEIARYIRRLVDSKVKVTTKAGERPIEYSDICILLRNMKRKVDIFSNALKEYGIPSNAISDGDVSENKEIQLLASLVKVINNPLIDIPLVAVLFSPVFGFTADQLAEIRMIDKNAELYPCLEKYAQNSLKAKKVLDKLQLYRNIAASYPINEFIRFLIKDTGVENIYAACSDGAHRKANIRGFIKFADDFTNSGRSGLNSFIRSLDSAISTGKMQSYGGVSAPSGVQFMTIHKSKGLEFPYVIVADCSGDFNKRDSQKQLKISRNAGVGLKIRDDENFTSYHTLSSSATEKDILFGGASEELRVLYVAMTRAKEHVTFVCGLRKMAGIEGKVRLNSLLSYDSEHKLHPYAVYSAGCMSEWLLSCFARHKDCKIVCDLCDIRPSGFVESSYSMDVSSNMPADEVIEEEGSVEEIAPVDDKMMNILREKTEYIYEYDCTEVLAKITASSAEKNSDKKEYFARRKPKFINDDFTGADRGTAIHKFFEICDFQKAYSDVEAEKKRLLDESLMTENELDVLDNSSVVSFFESNIGQRLLSSKEVLREYEFSFLKKAGEIYENLSPLVSDEEIVVQGKLDCAFIEGDGAVLIDYKSDKIKDEEIFKGIYRPQIELYSQALTECIGIKVKERYLYSFNLKKFIEL